VTRTARRLLGALTLSVLVLSGCTVVPAPGKAAHSPAARVQPAAATPPAGPLPSAVRVLTIAQSPWDDGSRPPSPVTVTDPAEIARIWALVDALPPSSNASYSCPMLGGVVTLTFRAVAGGPALAVVAAGVSGCAFVGVTVGRRDFPLGGPMAGRALAKAVCRIVGLHWAVIPPRSQA